MCLGIMKQKGTIIPKKILEKGFQSNDEGIGFAVIEKENGKNELNNYRGLFEFDEFWKEWEPRQHLQALIHFRDASSWNKVIDGKNCHPFPVTDDNNLVLIHNG